MQALKKLLKSDQDLPLIPMKIGRRTFGHLAWVFLDVTFKLLILSELKS